MSRNSRSAIVLERYGFSGERLWKLSQLIANDTIRRTGAVPGVGFDDLVGYLAEQGCKAALRYDPNRPQAKYGRGGGEPFASWLADILVHRVFDWFRMKSEGNADRRYFKAVPELVGDKIDTLTAIHGDAGELLVQNADQDMGVASAELGRDLSPDARWALVNIANPMAEGATEYGAIRESNGVDYREAKRRLELLREELGQRVEN
ncbi:MAG: hypothetical protein H0U05_08680 [Actinobacteria bacterium]|nr:hypothetical protein [Actinomycetota bacterium]